jgi:hypothetical protein
MTVHGAALCSLVPSGVALIPSAAGVTAGGSCDGAAFATLSSCSRKHDLSRIPGHHGVWACCFVCSPPESSVREGSLTVAGVAASGVSTIVALCYLIEFGIGLAMTVLLGENNVHLLLPALGVKTVSADAMGKGLCKGESVGLCVG